MKNIFQSGLALGIDTGACSCCNINFEWLFNSTTNLLWVDKIFITQTMWDLITKENGRTAEFSKGKDEASSKAIKLIFEILKSVNLIEIIDISNVISKSQSDQIFDQIDSDLSLLANNYNTINDGHIIQMEENQYCAPALWTLYASILLSQLYNANFTLEENELDYLKKLLPLKLQNTLAINVGNKNNMAINEVLRLSLPSINLGHSYLFDSAEICAECSRELECKDSYLIDIEKQIFNILTQREYDEVQQLCMTLDRICSSKFKNDFEIEPALLMRELATEKIKIQKNINRVFPKVERWNNLITTISTTLSLGAFIDKPILTGIGGAGLLVSQATKSISDYYLSKNKWVNFTTINKK